MFSGKTVISGGHITQIQHHHQGIRALRAFDRLLDATASSALYNSYERFDPPKCYPHTRVAILQRMLDWVEMKIDTEAFIMWLYGAAGAGKSAIAQSLAEMCSERKLLLAAFFFSRNDPCRDNSQRIIATLAYQIAEAIPASLAIIEAAIEKDPLIFKRTLKTQFIALVVEPIVHLSKMDTFQQTPLPPLIIIDGLDECSDGTRTQILDIVSNAAAYLAPILRFLIASRPEQDISSGFTFGTIQNYLTRLLLDDDYNSPSDIEHYLRDQFTYIRQTHPLHSYIPSDWPTNGVVDHLKTKSSGQFVYAATAIAFISSPRHQPMRRLESILRAGGTKPSDSDAFAELDALYKHILSSVEEIDTVLQILATTLLARVSSEEIIGVLNGCLDLSTANILMHLTDMKSLIRVQIDYDHYSHPNHRISFLHASLGDFLFDHTRSDVFYINPQGIHANIGRWCLEKLRTFSGLHYNPLETHNPFEIYAKRFLVYHCLSAVSSPELILGIQTFPLSYIFPMSPMTTDGLLPHDNWIISASVIYLTQAMEFHGSVDLHAQRLSLFDQHFVDFIGPVYTVITNIIPVLKVIPMLLPECLYLDQRIWVQLAHYKHLFDPKFFDLPDFQRICNFCRHPLGDNLWEGFGVTLAPLSHYEVDEYKYAIFALRCVQFLHRQLLRPRRLKERSWAIKSTSRPWLTRKKKNATNTASTMHVRISCIRTWDILFLHNNSSPEFQKFEGFNANKVHPALSLYITAITLPYVLDKSAPSTDLITAAESFLRCSFPYTIFPHKMKVVKRRLGSILELMRHRKVDSTSAT